MSISLLNHSKVYPNPFSLDKRATSANCLQVIPKCSASGIPGDSRCKFYPSTTTLNGCPACDCQKCPDQKLYHNNVKDYCTAQTSTCTPLALACLATCANDPRCKSLPYNNEEASCDCACQQCPDGQIYGPTNNYKAISPLTSETVAQCPHILHPPPQAQNLCS